MDGVAIVPASAWLFDLVQLSSAPHLVLVTFVHRAKGAFQNICTEALSAISPLPLSRPHQTHTANPVLEQESSPQQCPSELIQSHCRILQISKHCSVVACSRMDIRIQISVVKEGHENDLSFLASTHQPLENQVERRHLLAARPQSVSRAKPEIVLMQA